MGYWMRQLLATLCVDSSLGLVALGGSDPTSGFHLRTLSFNKPPSQVVTSVSLVVAASVMCEELGKRVNLVYRAPYCV
jgi:hypothetical protein